MSALFDWLMSWPKERLAKALQDEAKNNAALKRRVVELEVEIFWMKAREQDGHG